MRPGYLQGYREDIIRPGNFGSIVASNALQYLNSLDTGVPAEYETGYIPEYMRYSKFFPNYPATRGIPFVRPRDPMTFNVLMF